MASSRRTTFTELARESRSSASVTVSGRPVSSIVLLFASGSASFAEETGVDEDWGEENAFPRVAGACDLF